MAAITKEGHPENQKATKEASNSLASLQVLTSSLPPTLNLENASSGTKFEVKTKRTRKKKVPSKVNQKPILPKMFAIQIAPQASVIAPFPPIMNPAVVQTSARLAGPMTYQPTTQVLPMNTTKTMAAPSNPTTCSKAVKKPKKQAKTREESIELAGKFHYASNDKEPAQYESEQLMLNTGGFPARHRSRLVHNATEKRRKEKINGWIGKIATVLFKYSPEKQHKIYILEKAYDFIAEKNRPHLEMGEESGNEKQDAFTQSESANEDTLPDLVAKIAELENLASTLLKVIEKHKIPTPSCLFKSAYTKSKFEAIRATNSCRMLEGFSDDYSKNDNVHNELNIVNARDCVAAGIRLDVPINVTAAAPSPIYSLQVQPNTTNTTIQSSCEMVTVVNDSRHLPPCTQPLATATKLTPDVGSLTTTGVSMRLSDTSMVNASDVRPFVQISRMPQRQSSNAQFKQSVNGQEVVSLPVQQQNRNVVSLPKSNLMNVHAPVQSLSSGQGAGNYIQQNASVVSQRSGSNTVDVTQNVPSFRNEDALSANGAASNDSIPITTTAPTMESQMFVMKNLVHPRSKNADCGLDPSQDTVPARSAGGKNDFAPNDNAGAQSNIEHAATVVNIKDRTSSQPVLAIPQNSSSLASSNVYAQVRLPQTNTAVQNNASFVRVATSMPVSGFSSNVQQLDPGLIVNPSRALQQQNYAVTNVQRFANTNQAIAAMSNIVACSSPAANTVTMRQTQSMVSNQNGAGGTQTCHSVTSLLGSSTTSPTENLTLSMEAILANTATGARHIEKQVSMPSKRATNSEIDSIENLKQGNIFGNQNRSNVETVSRKRSTAARDQNIQNHAVMSDNIRQVTSLPQHKPPAKRPRRNAQMQHTENRLTNTVPSRSAVQIATKSVPTQVNPSRNNSKIAKQNEERSRLKKQTISNNSSVISNSRKRSTTSLPKPQNFVSLARKNPGRKRPNNGLDFSAEALIRSNNLTTAMQQNALNEAEQEMTLPTILNIFAPASVGNMVSQLPVSNNTSNIQNQVNNSTFPTIQSTFSNFSAEALIGGTMESQPNVSAVINAVQNASENTLGQQEQQSLFTDFSTDALLAGTESSLSYGIDNIMSRNDVVASNSCISPNWLQNGSFIDNSPIRGSFNPGFNIFDTPNGFQGHMSLTSNSTFSTPIKWRQDVGRIDEQGHVALSSALTANGQLWSPTVAAVPHSKTRSAQAKEKQRSKVFKNQPNSKRGPSYGDFLLVDSVS